MGKNAVLLIAVIALSASGLSHSEEPPRTDWFQEAGWGVFIHFLAEVAADGAESDVERWNRIVDGFDVEGLAAQLASIEANYLVLTLGQNSGFYCAPNATYDRLVGNTPAKCSSRDLVEDLYGVVHTKGIRILTYLPAGAPDKDPKAMKALEWKNGRYPIWEHPEGGPGDGDPRLEAFQLKWESVVREWSLRWKGKVSGWWFDGCYFPLAMYKHPDAPNFASFAAAARSGNPDAIVGFNPGVRHPIRPITEHEDYAAGEVNDPDKVECKGRFVDGVQFHMLSYLGERWGYGEPRFTDEQVIGWTRDILAKKGVVTWEVPILPNGLMPQPFVDQLKALNEALGER